MVPSVECHGAVIVLRYGCPVLTGVIMNHGLTRDQVLRKTSKGREEQQCRSQRLTARQRHVLILCDGRRTLADICGLMGDDALSSAQGLVHMRMIEPVAAVVPSAATAAGAAAPRPEGTTTRSESALSAADQAAGAGRSPASVPPPSKRSLALARMYMFDMVERLLGAQSGPARAHLRAAAGPDAVLPALHECLGLIAELAGADQAGKVQRQLSAMLPEDLLDAFERGGQADFALTA